MKQTGMSKALSVHIGEIHSTLREIRHYNPYDRNHFQTEAPNDEYKITQWVSASTEIIEVLIEL